MSAFLYWLGAIVAFVSTFLMGVIGLYGTREKYGTRGSKGDPGGLASAAKASQERGSDRSDRATMTLGSQSGHEQEDAIPDKTGRRLFQAHCTAFTCGVIASIITIFMGANSSQKAKALSDKVDDQKELITQQTGHIANIQEALGEANAELRMAKKDREATGKELAATKTAADNIYRELLQLRPIKEKYDELLAAVSRSGRLSEDVKNELASQELERKRRQDEERVAREKEAAENLRRTTQNYVATFHVPEATGRANVNARGPQVKNVYVYVPVARGTLELQCEPGHGVHWVLGATGQDFSLAFDDGASRQNLSETVVTAVGGVVNFDGVPGTSLEIKFPQVQDPHYEISTGSRKKTK